MSGTSALRVGAEFLVRLMGKTIYYYSDPTWGKYRLGAILVIYLIFNLNLQPFFHCINLYTSNLFILVYFLISVKFISLIKNF